MYELPTDTVPRQLDVQPNTPAPIAVYEGNGYQWVSPRSIALIGGGLLMLVIGAIAMRSTAINNDQPIKIAPLAQPTIKPEQVNQVILEKSKASLAEIKIATDLKMEEVTQAMLVERSTEILTEAKNHLKNPKSDCFRSPYQQACYISTFIPEMQKRYEDAVLARKWSQANQSLFDIKAARYALDGSPSVPFTPNVTSAAIIKEMEARINILKQSDNALAADIYGGKR